MAGHDQKLLTWLFRLSEQLGPHTDGQLPSDPAAAYLSRPTPDAYARREGLRISAQRSER